MLAVASESALSDGTGGTTNATMCRDSDGHKKTSLSSEAIGLGLPMLDSPKRATTVPSVLRNAYGIEIPYASSREGFKIPSWQQGEGSNPFSGSSSLHSSFRCRQGFLVIEA